MAPQLHDRARPEPSGAVDDRTFRLLIEQVKDHAIFLLDLRGRNVTWNEGVRKVFGYDEAEWIGRPATELFTPEDIEAGIPGAELRTAIREGSASDDRWLVRKGGARFFASGMTNRLVDASGRTIGFAKVVRDTTEQRRSEERVRAAEEKARLAADAAGIGYFRFFASTEEVELDERAAALFGRPREELRTLEACIATVHPDEAPTVRRTIREAMTDRATISREYRVVLPDGEIRWLRAEGSTLFGEEGEVLGLTGVYIDVTPAKRSAEALRIGEERLRLAQAAAGIATWDWDLASRAFVCSPEWYAMRGLPPSTGARHDTEWAEGVHPEDRDSVTAAVRDAHLSGAPGFELEYRVLWPDGSVHWLTTRGGIHRNERGEPVRIIGVSYEITAQKQLAERLRDVQRAEAIGRLAGGVAHEVNNQMTVVLGLSEFLLRDPELPERLRHDVEDVRAAADRSARIAEKMLAYSRRQVLKPEVIGLSSMVREQEPLMRRVLGPERSLELRLHPGLAVVRVDRVQMEQVLLNLVLNARDATSEGGTVTITTSPLAASRGRRIGPPPDSPETDVFVRLSVEDTGQGMSAETLAHVFDPFFTTKPVGQGTGLGLSTVYGVVAQHGGHITVESEPGAGTGFHVYLPVVEDATKSATEPRSLAVEEDAAGTVLVVDDEPAVRNMAARVLAAAGYEVLTASDGKDALATLARRASPVDLVVTDLVMPGMDGADLIRALSALDPGVPVVTVSGFAHPQVEAEASEGMHLDKPYSPRELCEKVREVLSARGEPRSR